MDSLPKEWDGIEYGSPSLRAKTRVTICIDSDMLRWFRRMGPDPKDLQKRLNRFVAFCGDTWVSF